MVISDMVIPTETLSLLKCADKYKRDLLERMLLLYGRKRLIAVHFWHHQDAFFLQKEALQIRTSKA
jgi:hypothetical protein